MRYTRHNLKKEKKEEKKERKKKKGGGGGGEGRGGGFTFCKLESQGLETQQSSCFFCEGVGGGGGIFDIGMIVMKMVY